MYAITLILNSVLPAFIPRQIVSQGSKACTVGFSNTPGPIKPMYYVSKDGKRETE